VIYKTLLIGLGQVGMGYDFESDSEAYVATLAKSFYLHPAYELAGGVDVDSSRRELFENKYKCPSYDSIEMAVQDIHPDVVLISVSTNSHFSVFIEVMNACIPKAILCEKPLSYKYDEAEKMVNLADKKGVLLFTNYSRRCDQAVIEIRRRIVDKEIKPSIKGVCWYTKGLLHNGSHFLNLFQYWLGKVVNSKVIESGRKTDSSDIEPDVRITFELGEVYFISIPEENFSHCACELVAENGRLRYEQGVFLWNPLTVDYNYSEYTVLSDSPEIIKSELSRMQWHVAEQLSNFLSGEDSSICTGTEGLSTLYEFTKIAEHLQC